MRAWARYIFGPPRQLLILAGTYTPTYTPINYSFLERSCRENLNRGSIFFSGPLGRDRSRTQGPKLAHNVCMVPESTQIMYLY